MRTDIKRNFEGKTQREIVLEILLDKDTITPAEAWDNFNCTRLAAVIKILRNENYPIDTDMLKSKKGKPFAQYRMNKKYFAVPPKQLTLAL